MSTSTSKAPRSGRITSRSQQILLSKRHKASHKWVQAVLHAYRSRLEQALKTRIGSVLRVHSDLACGAHGCVLDLGLPGLVLKLTDDTKEARAALIVQSAQRSGQGRGMVPIDRVLALGAVQGSPAYAIVRSAIRPVRFSPIEHHLLSELAAELRWRLSEQGRGLPAPDPRTLSTYGLIYENHPRLRPVLVAYDELHRMGLVVGDLHGDNIGLDASGKLVVHDLGESIYRGSSSIPHLPSLGAANRGKKRGQRHYRPGQSCPQQPEIEAAVTHLLGSRPKIRSCRLVSAGRMERVVSSHGWDDAAGVVGFHDTRDRLHVLADAPWSTLHEVIHAAGVVDYHLGRWVCEGLTELVADEVVASCGPGSTRGFCPIGGFHHRPTYDEERSAITETLSPLLGITPLQLARIAVHDPNPARALSDLLVRQPKWKQIGRKRIQSTLDRGTGDEPASFLELVRDVEGRSRLA